MSWTPFTIDRLPERTERIGECLVWTGANDGREGGYGRVWIGSKGYTVNAHRWVWEQTNGPVPDGLMVRHKCDNPPCVNIEHLELGTALDNTRDRDERGRNYYASRTECVNGHEWTEENTYRYPDGHRLCRACGRDSHRRAAMR